MFEGKKKIHFVGIGGIGMSAIAMVLLKMGYEVSGSDAEESDITRKLEKLGGNVFKGHRPSNVPEDAELVVYSSCIKKDNPELISARASHIPVVMRAEALAEIFNAGTGIAVTGTHGKTTTTSLIAVMMENSGFDPTVMVGGEVDIFKGNAKVGKSPYVVAEADESDGSFKFLKPAYSVITNIEMEHIDHYRSINDALDAYAAFADNLKSGGKLFYNNGDQNIKEALRYFKGRSEDFGFSGKGSIYPVRVHMDEFRSSFECVYKEKTLGSVELSIPGMHNVLNALAAILVGMELGLSFDMITGAIKGFKGAKRRFHLRADSDGVMLIDDYAHHPTEIRAVLETCRNWKGRRIIAIFQPHRYSRTLFLADDFGKCFRLADKLILTDIYAASEEPIEGVSADTICERVKRNGQEDVIVMRKQEIAEYVMKSKKPGDIILVLGAGDIKEVADELSERISGKRAHEKRHSVRA